MRFSSLKLVVLMMFSSSSFVWTQSTQTAREIVEISRKSNRLEGLESISEMTIIDQNGFKRVRRIAQVSKLTDHGLVEKKLARFLSPPEVKGTGLLTFDYLDKDDDMWLFIPALRKTRRIMSSEKANKFMGSEFTYADMNPPNLDDYAYKLIGIEQCKNSKCWKIEEQSINDEVAKKNGYSKRMIWISQSDYVMRRAIYYDVGGVLHKELNILKVKEINKEKKKYRPVYLHMVNKQNSRESILEVVELEYSTNVKDEFFTIRYLEKP